jgi:hypothetical protein
MEIILAHLVGDYLIQSNWMATRKTSAWWPAILHGLTYTIPFLLITQSPWALLSIGGTHIVIDRYRLARHLVWLKNLVGPRDSHAGHTATGYPDGTPVWLATWLMIIADNTIHLLINVASVAWL